MTETVRFDPYFEIEGSTLRLHIENGEVTLLTATISSVAVKHKRRTAGDGVGIDEMWTVLVDGYTVHHGQHEDVARAIYEALREEVFGPHEG